MSTLPRHEQRLRFIGSGGVCTAIAVDLYVPEITDRWAVAYVLWVMANTYGQCRFVSVACPEPAEPPLTLFEVDP